MNVLRIIKHCFPSVYQEKMLDIDYRITGKNPSISNEMLLKHFSHYIRRPFYKWRSGIRI